MPVTDKYSVSKASQEKIIKYCKALAESKAGLQELYSKMEAIDKAYARYKGDSLQDGSGKDSRPGEECCGNVFGDATIPPIVVAQVDSMVAYLAEIFLSGYPLFPVVSPPDKRANAEKLEVLLDDHAQLGGYVRQLLLMLKDAVKYNASAIEINWDMVEQFSIDPSYTEVGKNSKIKSSKKYMNHIKRLDMYNTIWDTSVPLGDVARDGDYAGYFELITKTKLKRIMNKLSEEESGYNHVEVFKQDKSSASASSMKEAPTISSYVSSTKLRETDWAKYFGATSTKEPHLNLNDGSIYEKFVVYARIIPSDFLIIAPKPNTPQIWKFVVINMTTVIEASRIISAYDYLPILFGQPMEDGLGLQTQSVAEGAMPFQDTAATLYSIRIQAARRAVSDRALYDIDLINPSDVNSKAAAPKIPVRFKALSNRSLDSAYKQIPFDMRGTETTLQDARLVSSFAQELSGINGAQQGMFQKGNKSVAEFTDVMAGSDNRLRLTALLYEYQVFSPLKQILTLNIFQYGQDAEVVSQRTGETISINLAELRTQVLSFKLADGYTPKSKIAATEILTAGMNMIMNSPALQSAYGDRLAPMFSHMMQLGGLRDFDMYTPQQIASQPAQAALTQASLQPQTADPNTAVPAAATPAGDSTLS